jgi:hypothetical protein
MIKNILKFFFIFDLLVLVISFIFDNYIWFINIQVSSFSMICISIASFLGYKRDIYKKLGKSNIDDNIYNDDKISKSKNSIKNLKMFSSSFISIYRVIGYLILIIGFFILRNSNILDIYSYFIGFIIVSLSMLCTMFISTKNSKNI